MATYHALISWERGGDPFTKQQYSRGHFWAFDEGVTIPASASPHVVKAPWAVTAAVDPEEAFVASISSCHMLFFLSFASAAGYMAESYEDAAEGVLSKNAKGKEAMSRVTLRPVVTFSGKAPGQAEFDAWHHKAHDECYIANSVITDVLVEPSFVLR